MITSLRKEAAMHGVSAKSAISDFREALGEFFTSPTYQNHLRRVINPRAGRPAINIDNRLPQRMMRAPLAYALVKNPEPIYDVVASWNDDHRISRYNNDYDYAGMHATYFNDRIGYGSMEYAAHLDVAMAYGAIEGKNLSAVVPTGDASHLTMPLTAYVGHLELDASELIDLASIYYRWGLHLVETQQPRNTRHIGVSLAFEKATSYSGYPDAVAYWSGKVPVGSELAWELVTLQWRRDTQEAVWLDAVERSLQSGASVQRFNDVVSRNIPLEQALAIVENSIDDEIMSALKGAL
jgi:hypothetical protein